MIYVERDRAVVADDVRRVPAARSRLLACGCRGAYRKVPGRFRRHALRGGMVDRAAAPDAQQRLRALQRVDALARRDEDGLRGAPGTCPGRGSQAGSRAAPPPASLEWITQ